MPENFNPYSGTKNWTNEIAAENIKEAKDNLTYARPWRANGFKLENARYGRQYSTAELNELIAFRQAPLPISVSTAICDTADALMIAAKPEVYVAPIMTPGNQQETAMSQSVAEKFKFVIQKSWFDSLGMLQYDRIQNDVSNVGKGLMYMVPRNEIGEFNVDMKRISWRYYLPHPNTKEFLDTDADNMIYAMPITKRSAIRFIKSIEPDISEESLKDFLEGGQAKDFGNAFDEDPVFGNQKKAAEEVLFIQRLVLESQRVYYIIPISRDFQEATDAPLRFRTVDKLTNDLIQLRNNGKIKLIPRDKVLLTEYTSVGNYGYKVVYPITKYNIVPFNYDHRDNPYPYSRMWYLYPLQRGLNRFLMSAILNNTLSNSLRVMAEEGSIINQKEFIKESSSPGSILQYRLPIPGVSKPPDIIKHTPMSEAHLILPRYMTQMMEYISGIFGVIQGNPDSSPDVFSTLASLQSAGSQKIKRRMVSADTSLSQAGEVAAEFYKEHAPINGFSALFNEEKRDEEIIEYNKLEVNTDDPDNPKVGIDPMTDLKRGFRKVRFTTRSSGGYEAATEAAMLTTLSTQLGVPELLPLILDRIGVTGIKDIKDIVANRTDYQKIISQLEESNKKMASEIEQKNNKLFGMVERIEAAKAKGKMDVEVALFKKDPVGYVQNAVSNQGDR